MHSTENTFPLLYLLYHDIYDMEIDVVLVCRSPVGAESAESAERKGSAEINLCVSARSDTTAELQYLLVAW